MQAVASLRRHLRQLGPIVLLAIFGVVFAPTLSRLASAAQPWGGICSTKADDKAHLPQATDGGHCLLCALGAAPPPAAVGGPRLAVAGYECPGIAPAAPVPARPWAGARPRAPPAAA